MNNNKSQKKIDWTKKHWLGSLLAVVGGLSITFLGLHHNGKLEKLFQASYWDLFIIFIFVVLGIGLAKAVMYFARGKLELRGIRLEEIGDERAELVRQKAGFRAWQCFTLLACFISPVFLFFDYKAHLTR